MNRSYEKILSVVQRVPALRVFWDLEKTVLHETRVSGTVLWSPRVSGGPPVVCKEMAKN